MSDSRETIAVNSPELALDRFQFGSFGVRCTLEDEEALPYPLQRNRDRDSLPSVIPTSSVGQVVFGSLVFVLFFSF